MSSMRSTTSVVVGTYQTSNLRFGLGTSTGFGSAASVGSHSSIVPRMSTAERAIGFIIVGSFLKRAHPVAGEGPRRRRSNDLSRRAVILPASISRVKLMRYVHLVIVSMAVGLASCGNADLSSRTSLHPIAAATAADKQ